MKKTATTTTTDSPDLPPCVTALQAFIKTHEDLGHFASYHRLARIDHPARPFFSECLAVLDAAEGDPSRIRALEFWPWKDSLKFPIAEQRAMLATAQQSFENFKTSDPLGSRLAARDAEEQAAEQAVRDRLARKAAQKAAEAEAAAIESRIAHFHALLGPELLQDFRADHPDIDQTSAQKLLADPFDQNIVAAGSPGTAKTRCLARLALQKIKDGFTCEWIDASEFSEIVGSLGDPAERPAAIDRLAQLSEADFCVIDDLGSSPFTTARTARLLQLVDFRHRHQLPLAVSSNHSLAGIRRMLSEDRVASDRILRRIVGTRGDPRASVYYFKKTNSQP